MAVSSGVWYSGSVFFLALIRDFGWSYGGTASIFSVFAFLSGVWGVLAGRLVDRLGPRPVILAGGCILPAALAADGLAAARWHLYLTHGIVAPLGFACLGWVPVSILLSRRFAVYRGLALGLASGGVGLGITLFVPLAQALIERLGWRWAFASVALLVAAVALPVGWRMPREKAPAGPRGRRPGDDAWSLVQPMRRPEFWGIALAFVLLNAPVQLALTHQVAHLVESGLPRIAAAGLAGLLGLASIPGKVGWGYLSDRWCLEWTYSAAIAAFVAGLAGLLCAGPGAPAWMLYASAVGLGVGYAVSPALSPVLTGRFFPGPHFGTVFGTLAMVHNGAGAAGIWLGGYAHDLSGSYRLPLGLSVACVVLAAAVIWLLAPRRAPAAGLRSGLERGRSERGGTSGG